MVRQFNLTNADGAVFDLMRKDAWLHAPDGLGWSITPQIQRVGETFALLDTETDQPAPAGELMCAGYAQADEFRRFCAVGGLVLGYRPRTTWRYLDVVVSMDQGEIDPASGLLRCPLTFIGTSQWYEQLIVKQAQKPTTSAGKKYAYKYAYTYSDGAPGTVEIHNGALPSYPKIVIMGPVLNPSWSLFAGGVQKATGKMLGRIEADQKLVIDCSPDRLAMDEYTEAGDFVASRYGDSDFSTERFFALPPGDCVITFGQEETAAITAWVEVRKRV